MAAISPPTLTASSFCSAQKKESVIFLLQTMIKLNLKKKKKRYDKQLYFLSTCGAHYQMPCHRTFIAP